MRRFEGRICLLAGSTGIAAAAARALAAEGGSVFVVSRSAEHASTLATSIGAEGGEAASWAADLSREAGADAAVAACVDRFGRLDCLYHVAGISGRRFGDGPLHEMSTQGWEIVMAANATSTALTCRAAVRRMMDQEPDARGRRGTVLTMSSVLATDPAREHFATHAYAASKGAIEALSRSMAAYYAPHGIRVNCIAPALVATPMSERAQSDPRILGYLAEKQPLALGPMEAADLVGTALYLLSDDARMVTGQVITVDAGWGLSPG